ncbi:hypothetical protein MKW98_016520 [Papaver atlanticum]|uniref:N-acetyl-gamma-glutamyl-phosphate reductase dimerisation domain-containing protein n=1 Tax=Papaver atlanticum TaxID=357466 RepID=A0AAD4T2L3_9MAGN|nr:hypothetical protein MKW98_016520 [Papaver atlanticum]
MKRGMQANMYVEMAPGVTIDDLRQELSISYKGEEYVSLLKRGEAPKTQHVQACNDCYMNVFEDRIAGRAIIISVIDNLMKGASGQAVQNLNLMMGFPERTGLPRASVFP